MERYPSTGIKQNLNISGGTEVDGPNPIYNSSLGVVTIGNPGLTISPTAPDDNSPQNGSSTPHPAVSVASVDVASSPRPGIPAIFNYDAVSGAANAWSSTSHDHDVATETPKFWDFGWNRTTSASYLTPATAPTYSELDSGSTIRVVKSK